MCLKIKSVNYSYFLLTRDNIDNIVNKYKVPRVHILFIVYFSIEFKVKHYMKLNSEMTVQTLYDILYYLYIVLYIYNFCGMVSFSIVHLALLKPSGLLNFQFPLPNKKVHSVLQLYTYCCQIVYLVVMQN